MKKIILVGILSILLSIKINAQEHKEIRTIFNSYDDFGTYFAFSAKGGYYKNDKPFGGFGMQAGVVYNHFIAVGLFGEGFFYQPSWDEYLDDNYSLQGGYGGIFIQPIIFGTFPIHFSAPISFGIGGAGYVLQNESSDGYYSGSEYTEDNSLFFLVEPGLEIEFNIFRHFRMSLGAYYKLTRDLDLRYRASNNLIYPVDALDGLTVGISFKFGKF